MFIPAIFSSSDATFLSSSVHVGDLNNNESDIIAESIASAIFLGISIEFSLNILNNIVAVHPTGSVLTYVGLPKSSLIAWWSIIFVIFNSAIFSRLSIGLLWSTSITLEFFVSLVIVFGILRPVFSIANFVSGFNSPCFIASTLYPKCVYKYSATSADIIVSVSGFLWPVIYILSILFFLFSCLLFLFDFKLFLFIEISTPYFNISITALYAFDIPIFSSSYSSFETFDITWFIISSLNLGLPIPIRTRIHLSVIVSILLIPLWPPFDPFFLILIVPTSKSLSSYITIILFLSILKKFINSKRALPDRFINVVGFNNITSFFSILHFI